MAFSAASQAEDNILITNVLNGDTEAFGQLVKKHHELLFNLSFRMLGSREEAEDVIQQVFIEAYRHLKDFHREAQFSTWLYSITLNRTRNCLRSRKSRSLVSIDPNWTDEEQRAEIQLTDHSPSPEKQLEKKSDLEWLHKNVKFLSADYQAIVTLHYFQNLSLQDVSVRLGRPVATVKVYLHRARKELLKLWSEDKTRGESHPLLKRK
jgi:RNA polymerase sigma-70 factor (ECF subfamily)